MNIHDDDIKGISDAIDQGFIDLWEKWKAHSGMISLSAEQERWLKMNFKWWHLQSSGKAILDTMQTLGVSDPRFDGLRVGIS